MYSTAATSPRHVPLPKGGSAAPGATPWRGEQGRPDRGDGPPGFGGWERVWLGGVIVITCTIVIVIPPSMTQHTARDTDRTTHAQGRNCEDIPAAEP